ncbi:MAG: hypothetical protein PUH70_05040 [Clostridiales bacterium]|nr:hypothetical protein [Clostridiales bacterium]MDY5515500.1 hypothetical protein [Candidatus Ventricola sp.]
MSAAVLSARALLSGLTPLKADCGRLCGGACCQGDEATGMLLFPGEEALYAHCAFARVLPAGFSLGGQGVSLLVCQGRCERENRPLACRLFPLFLRFREDGSTRVVMDRRARALCPLTGYGLSALDSAFLDAARTAYDLLLADPACAAYLRDLDRAFRL